MGPGWDAVVLAGGRARRLGGIDKLGLVDDEGVRLLDRVLEAVRGCDRVVVVGPPREGLGDVVLARENPPFAGPVAALAAALPLVGEDWVLVLAGDQPRAGLALGLLRTAAAGVDADADGVVLVDVEGRRQWLCAAYRASALRAALDTRSADDVAGAASEGGAVATGRAASLREVLGGLALVAVPDAVGGSDDVDTPEDVSRLLRG